jgi:hypothetical protein
MVERGEVEKVRIVRGSSDKNGIRMDAITVKGGERVLKANVASSKQEEWRWRLVEKRLNNEHTLDDLPESKK